MTVAGRGRTRRANAPGGPRSKRVVVKLTEEELERLQLRADAQGVTVQGLMVGAALSDGVDGIRGVREIAAEVMKTQRLVGNVADNMNQIARKANTVHEIPSDFKPALAEARSAWFGLEQLLDRFDRFERRAGV